MTLDDNDSMYSLIDDRLSTQYSRANDIERLHQVLLILPHEGACTKHGIEPSSLSTLGHLLQSSRYATFSSEHHTIKGEVPIPITILSPNVRRRICAPIDPENLGRDAVISGKGGVYQQRTV